MILNIRRKKQQLLLPGQCGFRKPFDPSSSLPQKPICLLVDNSLSTSNGIIDQINRGRMGFAKLLQKDSTVAKQVRIAKFSFGGGLREITDGFVSVAGYRPDDLIADGNTPMGESLIQIIGQIRLFKELAIKVSVELLTFEVVILTDGVPTDRSDVLEETRLQILDLEEEGLARFSVYVVGGCDTSKVESLFSRRPEELSASNLFSLFQSLSISLRRVSRRNVGKRHNLQAEIRRLMKGGHHD